MAVVAAMVVEVMGTLCDSSSRTRSTSRLYKGVIRLNPENLSAKISRRINRNIGLTHLGFVTCRLHVNRVIGSYCRHYGCQLAAGDLSSTSRRHLIFLLVFREIPGENLEEVRRGHRDWA